MANWLRSSKFSALLRDAVKPLMGPNTSGRNAQLTQYGLLQEDILQLTPAISKALSRLPPDVALARERRLYRAVDLNFKKKSLPDELQCDPTESYFGDLIHLAEQEIDERERLNHY